MPRYQTSGIPPDQARLGLSAFMPHFNRLAASGAMSYKGGVTGYPGTRAVPVGPTAPPAPDIGDMVLGGSHAGYLQPDKIWPNQYWVTTDPVWDHAGGTAQVQVYCPTSPELTTMIPVPATDLRGLYQARSATLAGGVRSTRTRNLRQAANFIRWPKGPRGNGSNQ